MRAGRPPGPVPFMIWCCDPWDTYIRQIEDDCRREALLEEIEMDLGRERELLPPTEIGDVEYVEVELLAEVQR